MTDQDPNKKFNWGLPAMALAAVGLGIVGYNTGAYSKIMGHNFNFGSGTVNTGAGTVNNNSNNNNSVVKTFEFKSITNSEQLVQAIKNDNRIQNLITNELNDKPLHDKLDSLAKAQKEFHSNTSVNDKIDNLVESQKSLAEAQNRFQIDKSLHEKIENLLEAQKKLLQLNEGF